jgi:hypothetical protein
MMAAPMMDYCEEYAPRAESAAMFACDDYDDDDEADNCSYYSRLYYTTYSIHWNNLTVCPKFSFWFEYN